MRTEWRLHLRCRNSTPRVRERAVVWGGGGRGRGGGAPGSPRIPLLYGVCLLGFHHRLLDLDSVTSKYGCAVVIMLVCDGGVTVHSNVRVNNRR